MVMILLSADLSIFDVRTSFLKMHIISCADWSTAYFEQVHPIYPFLDQTSFEGRASSTHLETSGSTHETWLALYHTVLSLGCMYHDGGSFEPAKGLAWHYFSLAFRHFQDVLICKASLLKAQVSSSLG